MFDSSWNSAAFQRFCGEIGVMRNGDRDVWIVFEVATGNVIGGEYHTREQAEEARRELYDRS